LIYKHFTPDGVKAPAPDQLRQDLALRLDLDDSSLAVSPVLFILFILFIDVNFSVFSVCSVCSVVKFLVAALLRWVRLCVFVFRPALIPAARSEGQ